MTTQAQVHANRHNAQHSTGPRTSNGKAIASGNALTHGLLAREVIVADEDQSCFRERRDAMHAHLNPQGALEDMLVERIVECAWRLRRVGYIEASVFRYYVFEDEARRARAPRTLTQPHGEEAEAARDRETLAIAFIHAAKRDDTFTKLSRYEAAIDRSFYRALRELQRLQADRLDHATRRVTAREYVKTEIARRKAWGSGLAQAEVEISTKNT